ncbi:hypothetical protein AB1E18_004762 [Capra hircus]
MTAQPPALESYEPEILKSYLELRRTSLAIKGISQPRAEQEKVRFQRKELFTIKANWIPHRHGILYTKTELTQPVKFPIEKLIF